MFTVVEKNIWKLPDGKIWEGDPADLPVSQADLIAHKGREYPTEWLKEQGWGKKAESKKDAPKKSIENKAVKPKDTEDK
jgi:hypothetical protein